MLLRVWGLSVGLCLSALCQPYEHWTRFKAGASRVYRGYSSWVMLFNEWHDRVFTITNVDPESDRLTAPGHNYVSGKVTVWINSTGSVPGGTTNKRIYWVCDVQGDTFKLGGYGSTACSSEPEWQVDIIDAGSGVIKTGVAMDNGPPPWGSWPVYLAQLSGVPSGVTYEVWCEHTPCPAVTQPVVGWRSSNGAYFFMLYFTAAKDAQLGTATITATIYPTGEEPEVIQFPLTVVELEPIPSVRPSSYPPIPQLQTFNSSVYTMSLKWCDPTSYQTAASSIGTLAYGVETGIWFYDGAWTFRQVARYLNDARWNNCADYINDWYRDYTLKLDGHHVGYKAFTAGLKSSCASCDMRNRLAIIKMAGDRTAGLPTDWVIRETAYELETLLSYELVTGTPYMSRYNWPWPNRQRAAENLLAMFDELFRDGTWRYHQTYWDGLALRALIQYFELTGDQRVPVEIKNALDWLWTNAWNDNTKQMVYNPANWGPRCNYGCADQDYGWTWLELMGLVIPASAWYYWYSGDDTYRQRGDEWFKALPRWPFFTAQASTDRITVTAHALSVGDSVNIRSLRGYSFPGGLVNNGNYWVNNVIDENTFTVSTTRGGPTVNITSDGAGMMGLKCTSATCRGLYSGKMYNQLLRWAFSYVAWRQGQTPYTP